MTATTVQFTAGTGSATSIGAPVAYTRNGEVLALVPNTPRAGASGRRGSAGRLLHDPRLRALLRAFV